MAELGQKNQARNWWSCQVKRAVFSAELMAAIADKWLPSAKRKLLTPCPVCFKMHSIRFSYSRQAFWSCFYLTFVLIMLLCNWNSKKCGEKRGLVLVSRRKLQLNSLIFFRSTLIVIYILYCVFFWRFYSSKNLLLILVLFLSWLRS